MTERTHGNVLLFGFSVPVLAYAVAQSVSIGTWWSYAALGLVVFTMLLSVAFLVPDHTIVPVAEAATRRRTRTAHLASGRLEWDDVRWLLTRRRYRQYAFTADGVHDLKAELRFIWLIVDRATNDAEYGHVVQAWLRLGHGRTLLTDALTARLAPAVMGRHLDGTQPLDPVAVATLAALVGGLPADEEMLYQMALTSPSVAMSLPCGCGLAH